MHNAAIKKNKIWTFVVFRLKSHLKS